MIYPLKNKSITGSRTFNIIFFFLLFSSTLLGQRTGIPKAPSPQRLVNNLSKKNPNFLSTEEEKKLEKKLEKFSLETSNQIVIVIVDDLNGYEPFDFATELGQQWKVGQEKKDNGIVVLIKPTGKPKERKYFIAVGYGLHGVIPDLAARQIEDNELLPHLKKKEYYAALDKTTDVLMALAKGEYNSKTYSKKHNQGSMLKIIIILIIIIVVFIFSSKRGGGNGMTMGAGGIFFGGGFGSGFGGGSSGSGGGGGFGGFGGGGFGGGGSGGSW